MTERTYTNAEIVWPDRERTKVPSMRVEFREDFGEALQRVQPETYHVVPVPWLDPPRCVSRPLSASITFRLVTSAREQRRLRRMFAMVCWKCHDGRTRSHNRRCRYRGHGRNAEAS